MTEDTYTSTTVNHNISKNQETTGTKILNYQRPWDWPVLIYFSVIHVLTIYFLYALITAQVYLSTFLLQVTLAQLAGLGTTAGAHRLWSHQAYKARAPLRIFLSILYTMNVSRSIFWWVRTHRLHHKYTDTYADPHNSKEGFMFCHVLWIVSKKHPDVLIKEKIVNMRDLQQDWVVMMNKKYFHSLALVFAFLLPFCVPFYVFGESLLTALSSASFRLVLSYHMSFAVNSVAHLFGTKPYNRNITAAENLAVSIVAVGEGWHNYHHTFPWDYRSAELANLGYNPTTKFIHLCAKLGLAYNLKSPSDKLVQKQIIWAQTISKQNKVEIWDKTHVDEQDKKLIQKIS